MTLVRHRLLTSDGAPIAGQKVTAQLMSRDDLAPDSYTLHAPNVANFTDTVIKRRVSAISDFNGWLQWDLTPNEYIVPDGTYYQILGMGRARTILWVPDAGTLDLAECRLDLVDFNASNLVIVRGPRGKTGAEGGTGSISDSLVAGFVNTPNSATRTAIAGLVPDVSSSSLVSLTTYQAGIAAAKDRANHTGTQLSGTISDLTEAVQDIVGAFFGAGTGVAVTYNDAQNSLTVSATGGTNDPEAVRDAIGAALIGVGAITVTVNDAADTISIATTATTNSSDAALRDRSTHTGTQPSSTITGLPTVRVKDFGALGNGTSNDTTAIQNAINASPNGAVLWMDAGTYLVDGITLKTRQTLTGPSSRVYLSTAPDGVTIKARLAAQTAPVITLPAFAHLRDITVAGASTVNHSAVRATGASTVLERVSLTGAAAGFDGNYVGGHALTACQIHENANGVTQLVDSLMWGNYINANTQHGINLQSGCNDNMIFGNKIEWCGGYGVLGFQAENNALSGNIIDRHGKAGISITDCKHWSISGGLVRRCGKLSAGVTNDDCNIYQQSCTGISVTGVSTMHYRDDDNISGYDSPAACVIDNGGTDISYVGNDFTGYVTRPWNSLSPGVRRTYVGNAGFIAPQVQDRARPEVGSLTVTVDAAGTTTLGTFNTLALGTFSIGDQYMLHLVSRDTTLGSRTAAGVPIMLSRESGNAAVTVGTVTNTVGTAFGTTTGTYRVSATCAADGSTVTVTINNTSANSCQFSGRLV